jgi:hypothetical protein
MSGTSGWTRALAFSRSAPVALVLLVAANLIPLAGVLFWDWDVQLVLVMYWLENGIVGLLNIARILAARGGSPMPLSPLANGIFAVFFAVHYGIFWMVHGVFIMVITNVGGFLASGFRTPFEVVAADPQVALAALALLLSHGASLVFNYFGKGEYLRASPGGQMFAPYGRLVVLHVTIIVGGIFILGLGQPVALVALLVVLKIIVDLGFHLFERKRFQGTATVV